MLMESSFSSSSETSLLKLPVYQEDPFAAYDWVSLAETYQMIHKYPERSQINFLEAVPVPDAMNLDETRHQKLQVSCPVMCKVSEKPLTSLVYSRRKRSVRPGGTAEHNPPKNKKQDDSIVPVHNHGESTKRENRLNNCLVYNRKKRRGKSNCDFTEETMIRSDDAFVSGHDGGETKRRGGRLDNCLVYTRKKGRVKFNSCSFSKHVSEKTNISGDQTVSSAYSQRSLIVRAEIASTGPNPIITTNSGEHPVSSQSKQLAKSNGSSTESHIQETKRNGDRSDVLLMYSRRKQKGKSIGGRINGFLVYSRKKHKVKSNASFSGYANSTSHVVQVCSALEPKGDTQVTEAACSSDGTNDSCSSLKSSSELASGSSKTREDEATDCDSSDSDASETDTDGSSTPFRQCKYCDKPGTVGKMLICDECEEAYHTSCCGVRMNKLAEIDDWLCPSCLKRNSSKTKIQGKVSREQKWRATEPFAIGIRIGKKFQADVPDWSGPTLSDTSFVGKALVIDESESMHDLKQSKKGKRLRSAVNWLQCREEDKNGDICGKWRRAPRSEVQTKDWECFCCVFWDPSHADCAVPQELETDEILKQLKYIKMLRPRSDTKRRKTGPKGLSSSHNK